MSAKLPFHEWCVIVLFCTILLVLAGLAFGRQNTSGSSSHVLSDPPVTVLEVKIQGAVAKPGIYRLPLDASVQELLDQAQLLPQADLSQIKWRRKLQQGQTVRILERLPIKIYVEGAVKQPGPMQILSGTRGQELADQLDVLPEADMRALRKKRQFLRDGETVIIPVKKVKKSQALS
jgi:hypothetical protein